MTKLLVIWLVIMIDWMQVVEKGVYFVFFEDMVSHISVSLAEGLEELGIPIFSNQNCWRSYFKEGEYLFKQDNSVSPNDCAICIADISNIEVIMNKGKIHPFFQLADKLKEDVITIFLDMGDADNLLAINQDTNSRFRGVLKTHCNSILKYPNFYLPWSFGLDRRIIKATEQSLPFLQKKEEIIAIFRSSLSQSVRIAMSFSFLSHLQDKIKINDDLITSQIFNDLDNNNFHSFYGSQLKSHHISHWYQTLKNTRFCAAYGGNFHCANLVNISAGDYLENENIISGGIKPKPAVFRWDSWRFWESLAAGCVTIHLDFKQCGFLLPVQPINWKHYVGIDVTNPKSTAERILDEPELMAEISENGRNWALEHYSPLPVACRFLDIALGEELGTTQDLVTSLNLDEN